MINSTAVRATPTAAEARGAEKTGARPVSLRIARRKSRGRRRIWRSAPELPDACGRGGTRVSGENGYDRDDFAERIERRGSIAIIYRPRPEPKVTRECGFRTYRERHLAEVLFDRIRRARRISSRSEKPARTLLP